MTDLSNAERLDLASRVSCYFRQQAEDTGSPAYENLSDHDLMATLIGDLRQYADWRGVDFNSAVAAGDAAYSQHRAGQEFPYALGEEVEHRQRLRTRDFRDTDDDVPIACRGTVVSTYPEHDGTQTYHVRFPGEPDPRPLKSADIQPAPGYVRIDTSQGTLESLTEAEQVFVETGARIRSCQLRDAPPAGQDITDRDEISAALAEACALAPDDIPRLLAAEVTARAEEISRPWRPASASHPYQLAALDFPQPVQAAAPPGHSTDTRPPPERAQPARVVPGQPGNGPVTPHP
ncbi:MAG: hypothetical protein ACRDRJ_01755 [Streptosporangiaceae bacterium]